MRSLDIGGDKALSYFPIKEDNPFLGWRGIRVTLDHPEIFLVQTRAMLKASEGLNNLRILLPMISGTHELEEALHLIHRAWGEVRDEGTDVPMPPIGRDDRNSGGGVPDQGTGAAGGLPVGRLQRPDPVPAGRGPQQPTGGRPLRLPAPGGAASAAHVVRDAHAEGKPVSICGEMAGDPAAAVLLMAMGDSLSMNATNLPKVKWMLRQINLSKAKELLAELMTIDNPQVIHSSLQLALKNLGLARMINPAAAKPCTELARDLHPCISGRALRSDSGSSFKVDLYFAQCPPCGPKLRSTICRVPSACTISAVLARVP
jgi:phosphotransferase system enzyme I (PtsP)